MFCGGVQQRVNAVAFSPKGDFFVTAGEMHMQFWAMQPLEASPPQPSSNPICLLLLPKTLSALLKSPPPLFDSSILPIRGGIVASIYPSVPTYPLEKTPLPNHCQLFSERFPSLGAPRKRANPTGGAATPARGWDHALPQVCILSTLLRAPRTSFIRLPREPHSAPSQKTAHIP